MTPNTDIREAAMLVAEPLYVIVVGLGLPTEVFEGKLALPSSAKLAQVILVLFAKWTTTERLPKKAPIPGRMEANGST